MSSHQTRKLLTSHFYNLIVFIIAQILRESVFKERLEELSDEVEVRSM